MVDNDPWVSVIGEMLRNYPRLGTINFDFQSNTSTFLDLVNEIKKIGKGIFVVVRYFNNLQLCF